MKFMRRIITFLFCSILSMHAFAHKPVLNENSTYPADAPYEIEEPEISKAIYSTLTGDPHYYRIQSEIDFDFYAGILDAKVGECALEQTF